MFGSCIIHILYTGVLKLKKLFRRQKVKLFFLNDYIEMHGQQNIKKLFYVLIPRYFQSCSSACCRFCDILTSKLGSVFGFSQL